MYPENKVAIVTGPQRGIGRAIAERFLKEGARVVVTDATDATDVAATFRASGEPFIRMRSISDALV